MYTLFRPMCLAYEENGIEKMHHCVKEIKSRDEKIALLELGAKEFLES